MERKRIARLLCALMLAVCAALPAQAGAEAAELVQTCMPINNEGMERSLFRLQMDNGQTLYLSGDQEEALYHKMEDVNFDGIDDLVTFPTLGASNFFADFYVYEPETRQYVHAPVRGGQICNYTLDAQRRLVISDMNDGARDGEKWIYAWKEGRLSPVRSMIVKTYEEAAFEGHFFTQTTDFSRYTIEIRDYTQGVEGGATLLKQVYSGDDTGEEDARRIQAAENLLMEGL